ncbi:TetR family transcriptional regulator [Solicola gregarius]|uniref:TetR family transcriptional regulator n=1 Tax=Solicola gregarius TaxID=2908642 RepID=A0AA46YK50_9ACTN|nr:TetR family transcriptional regulator [Solicola gregarius]UYM05097.1 TetR family transcriptional regulator [Solicola gregarius]
MGRWEPDARGRMIRAAIELFTERGFEQTTAAAIAERAGVTERTFFRYFSDKREVLFDGSESMQDTVHDAIVGAAAGLSPLDTAIVGMVAAGEVLADRREHAVRRADVIAANASLRERELLKLAAVRENTTAALRERGVTEPAATLAAHTAVTIFGVGVERWRSAAEPVDVADCIADAAAELRELT